MRIRSVSDRADLSCYYRSARFSKHDMIGALELITIQRCGQHAGVRSSEALDHKAYPHEDFETRALSGT
jgi:hypothetical protein